MTLIDLDTPAAAPTPPPRRPTWWRWAVVAATGLILVGVVVIKNQLSPSADPDANTPAGPAAVPEGAGILPAFDDLASAFQDEALAAHLPANLNLTPLSTATIASLTEQPLPRAILAALGAGGQLILVGPTGELRRLDSVAADALFLRATSLSPDGTMIALPYWRDLVIVDVRTGEARSMVVNATQPTPPILTWLNDTTVVLPDATGAFAVDVTTETVTKLDIPAGDIVTVQGDGPPAFVELVGTDASPALVTWDRSPLETGTGGIAQRTPVTGPPWLGHWTGPGWLAGQVVTRACQPFTVNLPALYGPATGAIAALETDGDHLHTLVSVKGTQLETLGLIGSQSILVAARQPGRTILLAWDPYESLVRMITRINADGPVSVADLRRTPQSP